MKIVVLSDTHVPISAKSLPRKVYEYLKTCDLIIHAGDIVEPSFMKELETFAPVRAVKGNMDNPSLQESLPEYLIVEANGKKIGIAHGKGPSTKVVQSVAEIFDRKVDIIIFGHSHSPVNEKRGNILFFNPGSPTDTVFAPYRSFGVLDISDTGAVSSEIIRIED